MKMLPRVDTTPADTASVVAAPTSAAPVVTMVDWTLSLQAFLYLQVLDALTTWVGFRIGLSEASPFIRLLMHWGPMAGVLASKVVAVVLGGYCVYRKKFNLIGILNYWYAALVVWNLALIVSR
jgi:hypothetical protein